MSLYEFLGNMTDLHNNSGGSYSVISRSDLDTFIKAIVLLRNVHDESGHYYYLGYKMLWKPKADALIYDRYARKLFNDLTENRTDNSGSLIAMGHDQMEVLIKAVDLLLNIHFQAEYSNYGFYRRKWISEVRDLIEGVSV